MWFASTGKAAGRNGGRRSSRRTSRRQSVKTRRHERGVLGLRYWLRSSLGAGAGVEPDQVRRAVECGADDRVLFVCAAEHAGVVLGKIENVETCLRPRAVVGACERFDVPTGDRKSTRLNANH